MEILEAFYFIDSTDLHLCPAPHPAPWRVPYRLDHLQAWSQILAWGNWDVSGDREDAWGLICSPVWLAHSFFLLQS